MNSKLRDNIERLVDLEFLNTSLSSDDWELYKQKGINKLIALFLEEYQTMAEEVIGENEVAGDKHVDSIANSVSDRNRLKFEQRQRLQEQIKALKEDK